MAFNIVVKAEPRSAAKGRFKCEVAADAIVLSQGKREIRIPVGVDVHYNGGNRFGVVLPDCRLELTVNKFGSFKSRLARDLAAFLSGAGAPPDESTYVLPWYFVAVSSLPFGIPVLTFGGLIPVVIGFGLAGACFSIAQKEEWSEGA